MKACGVVAQLIKINQINLIFVILQSQFLSEIAQLDFFFHSLKLCNLVAVVSALAVNI